MNDTYQYSPEQRQIAPQPVGERLRVTDIGGRFVEAALIDVPEISANHVAMSQTVAFEPEPQTDETSANHVPASRMAAYQIPTHARPEMTTDQMLADARKQIEGLN